MGIALDSKLDVKFHVDQKIKKNNKLIGPVRSLSFNVLRKALLTICKSLIRSHLDYGDILYNKPENEDFQKKKKNKKKNRKSSICRCLAITGAVQGTLKQRHYDELGLHSLSKRC